MNDFSIVLLGTYPPRRCGIATFTADLRDALISARPDLRCDVVAIADDHDARVYPPEVKCIIRQDEPDAYIDATRHIETIGPSVVCVQHEFGIFGGPAGDKLLLLLDSLNLPIVSTLHTILSEPNEDQKRVFERLIARSEMLVVMTSYAREILERVWGITPKKIRIIPHGAPNQAFQDTASAKARLGYSGRDVLLTYGLLSPNKGIATAIRAMPTIVSQRPKALYIILGSTHPNVLTQNGDQYRASLTALSIELGLEDYVRFVNNYVTTHDLLEHLLAADICVTPYTNEAQITSGTLSYAAALGKAIISTPFLHAQELLADGRGVLVPFGDEHALATAVVDVLAHPQWLDDLRKRSYAAVRNTTWDQAAINYLGVFSECWNEAICN